MAGAEVLHGDGQHGILFRGADSVHVQDGWIDRLELAHALGKLEVGRIAVMGDRRLQKVHQMGVIGMGFAAVALLVETADRQADDRRLERRFVLSWALMNREA